MTDSELMLLENLTYLPKSSDESDKAFLPISKMKTINNCLTVKEYLDQFDEKTLAMLDKETKKIYDGEISGAEWAAMIRQMKKSPNILNLKKENYNEKVGAICFTSITGEAVVAFRGTLNGYEWKDNVAGMTSTDTRSQKEALEYINNLPYDGITVVGHSKGGNKAQYVTLVAPEGKIKKCVSMDGQGFSQEFYDKYAANVDKRAQLIKNYSLEADFVNILLFPVPGAHQIYIKPGDDLGSIGENHSPNAFFEYQKDENGRWIIIVDKKGDIVLPFTNEDSRLKMLQDFVAFFMNNASEEEKRLMVELLGPLLAGVFHEGWDTQDIVDHLMSNKDALALFVAYFIKYIEVFDISQEDAVDILVALGLSEGLLETFGMVDHFANISDFVEFIYNQLTDGKRDFIIETLLKYLGDAVGADIRSVWKKIEEAYGKLDDVDADSGKAKIEIFDYSQECYNAILNSIRSFRVKRLPDFSDWKRYSGHGWFGRTMVSIFVSCINAYVQKTDKVCDMWEKRLNQRFKECWKIDKRMSAQITATYKDVVRLKRRINK